MGAETFPSLNPPMWPAALTRGGLWIIGIGLALAVLAGPLNRFALVNHRVALLTLAGGLAVLVLGALLAIIGLLVATSRRTPIPRGAVVLGIIVALAVIGYLMSWIAQGRAAPPIHDITTDLEDPPAFVAVREIRDRIPGVNPAEYVSREEGPRGVVDVAALQRRHYPGIRPIELAVSPGEALGRARTAAEALGWDIVALAPAEGRLEATDTTAFFGFKDDIVVRVVPTDGGSRVDVRSKSRVGRSDVGANAKRIREFLRLMQNG